MRDKFAALKILFLAHVSFPFVSLGVTSGRKEKKRIRTFFPDRNKIFSPFSSFLSSFLVINREEKLSRVDLSQHRSISLCFFFGGRSSYEKKERKNVYSSLSTFLKLPRRNNCIGNEHRSFLNELKAISNRAGKYFFLFLFLSFFLFSFFLSFFLSPAANSSFFAQIIL